jgi:hypothetical protein
MEDFNRGTGHGANFERLRAAIAKAKKPVGTKVTRIWEGVRILEGVDASGLRI